MIKRLLQIFPSNVIFLLGFISFLVAHVLERKKVISYDVADKLVLSITLVVLFIVIVREYIGKFKIYENLTPSKMYIAVWKVILCLIIAIYALLFFIGNK
jgi:hypothetical protein